MIGDYCPGELGSSRSLTFCSRLVFILETRLLWYFLSIGTIVFFLGYIYERFDPEDGFPLVPSFIDTSYVGIIPILVRHCVVKSRWGCRYGLSKVTVSCLEMRRVIVALHLGVRSLCVCTRERSLSPSLSLCLLVSVLSNPQYTI